MKNISSKNNRKGVTLVEVVIAMSLLAIVSTMVVMMLEFAVKENANNYKRSEDVNAEGIFAETYDFTKSKPASGSIMVEDNNISSSGNNKIKLNIKFGATSFDVGSAYTYKSKLNQRSKDVQYQLQFFSSVNSLDKLADPSKGYYFVQFYNDSAMDVNIRFSVPDTDGTMLLDGKGAKLTGENAKSSPAMVLANGKSIIGFRIEQDASKRSSAGYFAINQATDSSPYDGGTADLNITGSVLSKYADDDGIVTIHYMDSGDFLNADEYRTYIEEHSTEEG